ncbi:tetratricopeptide repeat-containing serine protease family protein [Nostoc sp. NMS8]|uniref:tetratricopeptide repeat-containing S1 family peptidase n=1 Tax=Nostoc sp. NMS8 TaxID=2815392 RepID=UPI0025F49595|nr:tetratricopeptide repeat-containing serine protease family protein [Nostoc sp. NMS8]MBN3958422.1 serine protease [Nostoc sp. NMS8]
MPTGLETAIVRICRSNGVVVGAGFLVSPKHVITCAHVVADALGISRDTQKRPTEVVYLDFPLIASEESLTGKVVFWRPVPPKGSTSVKGKEDIAGLELNGNVPEAAQPVDLIIEEDLRGHSFRTFGFPAGHDDGLEATGVLRGRQGTGWIQIEDIKETGVRLEPGFSGAPIWDEQLNGVVGMAVAADQKRPEAKVAFMIPTKLIATAWTALAQWTIPPLILTPDKRFRYWRNRYWLLVSIALLLSLGVIFIITYKNSTLSAIDICKNMSQHQETVKKIVIANFNNGNKTNILLTEKRLLTRIQQDIQKLDKIEVCYADEIVSTNQEAQRLGEEQKATLVVWGLRDSESLQIYLKGIKEEIGFLSSLSVSSNNVSEEHIQAQYIPDLISLMTSFNISMSYYLNQQIPKAREVLADALEIAESRKLGQNKANAEKLAEAYFFLGSMYEISIDSDCKNTVEACVKALSAYRKGSEYSLKPYQTLLNKGLLHEKLGETDEAIKSYEKIINSGIKSEATILARYHRAIVFLNKGKIEDAISDLETICHREPENVEYCHFLGLAELKAGKVEKAKKTYQHVSRYIDSNKKIKSDIINNLNAFAEKSNTATVTKAVSEIISSL